MRWTVLFLSFFLMACSQTEPSRAITDNTVKSLRDITHSVQRIEQQTTAECKTDALLANLEALKAQANTITGQVENISLACQTEKQVLEEKITVRDVIISFLLVLFLLIGYIKVRRKLLC